MKLTTANSDTPIQKLTELQELIEELEDYKRKLAESEIERRKAVDHARLYRSEKRIAEDTLDQKNAENIRLRKNTSTYASTLHIAKQYHLINGFLVPFMI